MSRVRARSTTPPPPVPPEPSAAQQPRGQVLKTTFADDVENHPHVVAPGPQSQPASQQASDDDEADFSEWGAAAFARPTSTGPAAIPDVPSKFDNTFETVKGVRKLYTLGAGSVNGVPKVLLALVSPGTGVAPIATVASVAQRDSPVLTAKEGTVVASCKSNKASLLYEGKQAAPLWVSEVTLASQAAPRSTMRVDRLIQEARNLPNSWVIRLQDTGIRFVVTEPPTATANGNSLVRLHPQGMPDFGPATDPANNIALSFVYWHPTNGKPGARALHPKAAEHLTSITADRPIIILTEFGALRQLRLWCTPITGAEWGRLSPQYS